MIYHLPAIHEEQGCTGPGTIYSIARKKFHICIWGPQIDVLGANMTIFNLFAFLHNTKVYIPIKQWLYWRKLFTSNNQVCDKLLLRPGNNGTTSNSWHKIWKPNGSWWITTKLMWWWCFYIAWMEGSEHVNGTRTRTDKVIQQSILSMNVGLG